MAHTSERIDIQTKVLNSMREHNAAGIIMCPAFQTPTSLSYRQAMREAGLPVSENWIIEVPITSSGRRQGVTLLALIAPQPTAVACYNDAVALGVLNELDSLGKRAGRDLAVVGFDDIAGSAHASPPLTTMAVGPARLGEIASRILLGRISGQEPPPLPKHHYARPKLVVRESSGWPYRGN